MSTYLVTGAAGFIASQVAARLLAAGHRVVGVDNLNAAYDVRLKEWRLAQLRDQPGFDFRRLDITDRAGVSALGAALAECAAVIHLAARAGERPSVADPWSYVETNVLGTLNVLELARQCGATKFVLASSSRVYGSHNPQPYHEDADTTQPLSPYAASKQAAEGLAHSYHALHGLDVSVLRYFTVYGPAGRPDMSVFRFVQWISEGRPVVVYGDGNQRRDFTYIDDIARGTVAALRPVGYGVFNLGGHQPATLLEVIRQLEALIGKPARVEFRPRHPADVPATWADITRAGQALDWRPETPLAQGLEQVVRWYQANRSWASTIATDL